MKAKKFYNLFSLQKRLFCIILAFIVVFVALIVRLFYIQIIDGKKLQIRATSQWLRDLPLSSKRGDIVDCNGVVLATSETTYDIYVRARNVQDATAVTELLVNNLKLDYEKTYKKVTNLLISESLIKMQVDEDTSLSLIKSGLKGIYLSQNVGRVYPFSDLLTQVLGYCSIDNSGQTGLENYYDKFLKGVDGKSLIQANAQGQELSDTLEYYLPSIAGENCQITIDVQIQSALETALKKGYEMHRAKGCWGIVLDATNGGILAMCNLPSFDLNNVPRSDLEQLNLLSKNSCVVDVYEPGSTFKIFTLLACLNEGLTTANEHFYCGGSCSVDGQRIKCWKTQGHGSQTLMEGFKNSCNCVFVNLVMRLGVERFYKYLKLLGIGQKTGVDISGESAGILMNESKVKNVDLARIGFGQSVAVTPLQMIRAVSAVVTGELVTPHLIEKINSDDKIIFEYNDKGKKIEIKKEVINLINDMLFNNINSDDVSTFVNGYNVGGKTGTAQKFKNGAISQGDYVSSFIGVYPTNAPKYITIICVDEPSNGAYYGGVVAKPIGKELYEKIFKIKNIMPDNASDLQVLPDVEMPDLFNKSIAEALGLIKALGLTACVDGEGEFVVSQLPTANTLLYSGDEVLLVTN